jgi:hypothetical protein
LFAAYLGNEEAVDVLLNAGAKAKARSHRGYTAIEIAAKQGHGKLAEHLIRNTGIRPAPFKIGGIIVRLLAAAVAIYTFLWTAYNGVFITGELPLLYKLLLPAAAANMVFWYLYFTRIRFFQNIAARGAIRAVIRSGVIGMVVYIFLRLPAFITSIPFIGDRITIGFYSKLPLEILDQHVWYYYAPDSASAVITAMQKLPFMDAYSISLHMLMITGVVVAGLLFTGRFLQKKYEKACTILQSV